MASVKQVGDEKFRIIISAGFDLDGKRIRESKTIEAKNLTEAKKQAKILEGEIEKEQIKNTKENLIFKRLSERFISRINLEKDSGDKAYKTVERYKDILLNSLVPFFGETKVRDIDKKMIEEYLMSLKQEGARRDGRKGGYSQQTIKHYYRLLHNVLNFAVNEDYIDVNACDKVSTPKVEKKEMIKYDESIVIDIINKLKSVTIEEQVCILIAIETGCRRSEIMGLEWQDFDFEKQIMTVRRTSQYTKEEGIHTIEHLKNGSKEKVITYSEELNNLLKMYREQQNSRREAMQEKWVETDRVFINKKGEAIDPRNASYWFKRFQVKNDMKKIIRLHDLRHLHISMLLLNGLDVVSVAKRAGHSSPRTTLEVYSHCYDKADYRPIEIMEGLYHK